MFRRLGPVASIGALTAALTLFFSIPGHVAADFFDCVYDPPQSEGGPSCCHCKETLPDSYDCQEASGQWMGAYRLLGYEETEYCSGEVCPLEDPCPNGGGGT